MSTAIKQQKRSKLKRVQTLTGIRTRSLPTNFLRGESLRLSSYSAPLSRTVGVDGIPAVADIKGWKFTYVAGSVYASNNVAGATPAGTMTFYPGTAGASSINASDYGTNVAIPVAPADRGQLSAGVTISTQAYGRASIRDLFQHFQRKRFNRIVLHYVPRGTGNNVANGADVVIAPFRSNAGVKYPLINGLLATSSYSSSGLLSVSGAKRRPAFEVFSIDLTPYIAGGSGSKQNEFATSTQGVSSTVPDQSMADVNAVIPCCYAISGQTVTAATNGAVFGDIYIEMDVDLLDWTGELSFTSVALNGVSAAAAQDIPQSAASNVDAKHVCQRAGESIQTAAARAEQSAGQLDDTKSLCAAPTKGSFSAAFGGEKLTSEQLMEQYLASRTAVQSGLSKELAALKLSKSESSNSVTANYFAPSKVEDGKAGPTKKPLG